MISEEITTLPFVTPGMLKEAKGTRLLERNFAKRRDDVFKLLDVVCSDPENLNSEKESADIFYEFGLENDLPWGVYGNSDLYRYDHAFFNLLNGKTLKEFIQDEYGEKAFVVELMGPGLLLRQLKTHNALGKGLAVSLGDGRSRFEKDFDANNEIALMEANLLLNESDGTFNSWNEVTQYVNTQADVVILRPLNGWSRLASVDEFLEKFIENSIKLLKAGGTAFIKLPMDQDPYMIQKIMFNLQGSINVDYLYDGEKESLRIKKI